jgi:two-component system OmpR family sensor kinase
VSSYGPTVSSDERHQLFTRFYRGAYARKVAAQGSGLGLYVAQQMAKVHGFQLLYKDEGPYTNLDNMKVGRNIFYFEIPI